MSGAVEQLTRAQLVALPPSERLKAFADGRAADRLAECGADAAEARAVALRSLGFDPEVGARLASMPHAERLAAHKVARASRR